VIQSFKNIHKLHKLHGLKEQNKDKRQPKNKHQTWNRPDQSTCHPGLSGSPPKRVAVW